MFPTAHQRLYPFNFYLQMRRLYPVVYDEHSNIWGVFRHGDVQSVLGDYRTFSSAPQTSDSPNSSSNDRDAAPFQRPSLLQSDPPYHRTLRGVIASAFTPIIIAKLESHIENIANEMLNEVILKGKMDLIDDLAYPLPVTIIAELLGVPIDDRNLFRGWADMIISSTAGDITDEHGTSNNIVQSSFLHYLTYPRRHAPLRNFSTQVIETSSLRIN